MGFFRKKSPVEKMKKSLDEKPMFNYKFKEPFHLISIDQITKNNGKTEYGKCRYLFCDENYAYYGFVPVLSEFVSDEYILRVNLGNEDDIVFFGKSSGLCYLFCKHIFLFERDIFNSTVSCVNTDTGDTKTYDWFNTGGGHFGHFTDHDEIKNIYTDNENMAMVIEIVRFKCDFHNNNIENVGEYNLSVKMVEGKFVAEKEDR